MEKKFYHERIKKPLDRLDYLDLLIAAALYNYHAGPDGIIHHPATNFDEALGLLDLFCAFEGPRLPALQGFMEDKSFQVELYSSIKRFATANNPRLEDHKTHMFAYSLKYDQYTIQQDFYDVLKKAKLKNLDWNMFPNEINAAIRLPKKEFLHLQRMDVLIEELTVNVLLNEDHSGREINLISSGRSADDKLRFSGATTFQAPFSGPLIVTRESSTWADLLQIAMRILVYISSGRPDLREQKNDIRYQSPTSRTPVRAHKDFTEKSYKVIGWGWLKERQQHVDQWGVEPYIRFQPVGEGRKEYRYVLVRGHTKSWKAIPSVVSSGSNQVL